MPSKIEIVTALFGSWRLICGDSRALRFFRADDEGFWTAAWAIVLALPARLLALSVFMHLSADRSIGLVDLVIEAEVFAVVWFGYALAVFYGLQPIGREDRFFAYMVPFYWVSVLLTYLDAVISLLQLTGVLPDGLTVLLILAARGIAIWVVWFLASTALEVRAGQAVAVVLLTMLFEMVVTKLLSPLL